MAEFPGFGRHCHANSCHLLDFLPVRCDACQRDFCASHYAYDAHNCISAYKKNIQVPVCPLCGVPIPVARNERPDAKVGNHIDSNCKSNPASAMKGRIYTNRCSQVYCKKRELIPIKCDECGQNFCLKHRFPADHDCIRVGRKQAVSSAPLAALDRIDQNQSTLEKANCISQEKVNALSEEEALARAIQESLVTCGNKTAEEYDRAVAEQLQRIEYEKHPHRGVSRLDGIGCCVS